MTATDLCERALRLGAIVHGRVARRLQCVVHRVRDVPHRVVPAHVHDDDGGHSRLERVGQVGVALGPDAIAIEEHRMERRVDL